MTVGYCRQRIQETAMTFFFFDGGSVVTGCKSGVIVVEFEVEWLWRKVMVVLKKR